MSKWKLLARKLKLRKEPEFDFQAALNSGLDTRLRDAHEEMLRMAMGMAPREAPKPPPPLPRRKSTEGIVAYRSWAVREEDGGYLLGSTAAPHAWEGPVLRDTDPPAERDPQEAGWPGMYMSSPYAPPPKPAGSHGIHAYKDVRRAMRHRTGPPGWAFMATPHTTPPPAVWGEVLLFGTVVVHETGYRAQCAMIRSLYVPPRTWIECPGAVDALAARYGCDVHTDYTKWIRRP